MRQALQSRSLPICFLLTLLLTGCGPGDYEALGEMGDVAALLQMLDASGEEVCWNAVRGLGIAAQHTRPTEHTNPGHEPSILLPAVQPVIATLSDESPKVRPGAAFALRWIAVKLDEPLARRKAVAALVETVQRAGDLSSQEQAAEGLEILVAAERIDPEQQQVKGALEEYHSREET